jgi:phosphatidylserine/phosphatidylglycerophosphate/cardiolipin synthase-like enzyme
MSKAQKRNREIEIDETDEDIAAEGPSVLSSILSAARAPLALVSAHRWKAGAAVAVAAVGLALGTGLLNVSALTSWTTQSAPGKTAVATATQAAEQPTGQTETAPAEATPTAIAVPSKPELRACFTPAENCMDLIVAAIDNAKSEILVQAYSFQAKPLVKALGRAHTRGVKVRVILDRGDERQSDRAGSRLIAERILPQVDTGVASAHNKVMIIDGDNVITGSFNFTEAAQKKNAENVLLIKGHPEVAAAYRKNWERRLAASRPYYGTMAPVM